MASSLSIEIKGLTSLSDKLKSLVPRVRQGARDTVAQTLLAIETDAKLLAPVDTGRLRSSIHAEFAPNGLSGKVAVEVIYAPYVELGTSRQRAQPFLFPAYEKHRQAFLVNLKANTKLF